MVEEELDRGFVTARCNGYIRIHIWPYLMTCYYVSRVIPGIYEHKIHTASFAVGIGEKQKKVVNIESKRNVLQKFYQEILFYLLWLNVLNYHQILTIKKLAIKWC